MDVAAGAIQGGYHSTASQAHDQSSYALRELIGNVPVNGEDGEQGHITSVDVWNGNLYIGTSLGDVLHYVAIPPDPNDSSNEPTYIFATKLQPPYNVRQTGTEAGVKQILLLPDVAKACILCNGTLTFYTLPELSPAFGGKIKQSGCLWVGGVDKNEISGQGSLATGTIIILGLRQNLRLIKIAENASKIRDIQLKSISMVQRRSDLACVADDRAYSLLDVVNQRKNELFPVSSVGDTEMPPSQLEVPRPEDSRDPPSALPSRHGDGHGRSISSVSNVSTYSINSVNAHDNEPLPGTDASQPARASSQTRATALQQSSLTPDTTTSDQTDPPRSSAEVVREVTAVTLPLMPNILSPTPTEFLLTTGTTLNEPGVGMFVNEEGDVMREPLEFSTYPESLVLEQTDSELNRLVDQGESRVLALVRKSTEHGLLQAIEVQSWTSDAGQGRRIKEWLPLDATLTGAIEKNGRSKAGLTVVTSATEITIDTVSSRLRQRQVQLPGQSDGDAVATARRNSEEDKFVARFAKIPASVLLYCPDRIFWVNRQPLLLRLENLLDHSLITKGDVVSSINVSAVQKVLTSISRVDAQDELEFLTLTYIRQKASLLLLGSVILQARTATSVPEKDRQATERALKVGEIDPRIVLFLIPTLNAEIVPGDNGIWVSQGLIDSALLIKKGESDVSDMSDSDLRLQQTLLQLVKKYLMTWRAKKGFGSIADEKQVFCSVDAALLHILLVLDSRTTRGPAAPGSIRAELNDLVDRGVDCFDRAIELFEQYRRLYVLSRLYQNRKFPAKVLETWCRILDGEPDDGGELVDGEHDLRRYLSKIRDRELVQKYGTWLARRNPKLGVQLFADEGGRVRFEPGEAVSILREHAPSAVQDYLEYLVFTKRQSHFANELITYYLDTVLAQLDRSPESKAALLYSYETYRALKPPKPTYRQFITENALEEDWWRNRLRLLQLLDGGQEGSSEYDSKRLRDRLAPYSHELVPEMIILDGLEGNHEEALVLLIHGLGDYDTAIRYCLHRGSDIFHPSFGTSEKHQTESEQQTELFEHLLDQFMRIEDADERLERASELLERFASFYDVEKVLRLIPDTWSIETVSGFLVTAFRRLLHERNETEMIKALSGAQNLRRAVEVLEKVAEIGPTIVNQVSDIE